MSKDITKIADNYGFKDYQPYIKGDLISYDDGGIYKEGWTAFR